MIVQHKDWLFLRILQFQAKLRAGMFSDVPFNRGFPNVDHSGIDARIVKEQNKFTIKGYL